MTCKNGIQVTTYAELNIYGQEGETGLLDAQVDLSDDAAIGGNSGEQGGQINICSGKVKAYSYSSYGAGIGGGYNGNGGNIKIKGGVVNAARGNGNGTAIGKGKNGSSDGSLDLYEDCMACNCTSTDLQGEKPIPTPVSSSSRKSRCRNSNVTIAPCMHSVESYDYHEKTYKYKDEFEHDAFCYACGKYLGTETHHYDTSINTCTECGYRGVVCIRMKVILLIRSQLRSIRAAPLSCLPRILHPELIKNSSDGKVPLTSSISPDTVSR